MNRFVSEKKQRMGRDWGISLRAYIGERVEARIDETDITFNGRVLDIVEEEWTFFIIEDVRNVRGGDLAVHGLKDGRITVCEFEIQGIISNKRR